MKITTAGVSSLLLTACLCVLLTGCSDSSETITETTPQAEPPKGQLSNQITPWHYWVRLTVDPDDDFFSGRTTIWTHLAERTDHIWLHGHSLQVSEVHATAQDGTEVDGRYRQVTDTGVAQVVFDKPLPAGEVTLSFQYKAPFNTNLEGLYKVSNGGNNYAFTQFQATSARRVFPSFDEPRFKVPFDISLEVRSDHVAVSSTPVVESNQLSNGHQLLRFQTTKPLPTYLIAIAVGPLDHRQGEPIATSPLRPATVPLDAYAAQGKGDQLAFGLANTEAIVLLQEAYFDYAYPYPKLSLLAVPDFAAGAMENVGAITYREQYLLQTPETPLALRQRFLSVHAHELAHQWFGNLVTPQWWDDIWLNEAFATWMAAKTMHELYPDQGYNQRMLASALETMRTDSLTSARQIRQPVNSHEDIGAAFDGITYQKGGAVLGMLEAFIGEAAFRDGIRAFMQKHQHSTANARDFVRAIASARPDLPAQQVEAAFFSFLEQPGIPLVDLDWHCDDAGKTTVNLQQSRYLPLGSTGDAQQSWLLPMCLAYASNGQRHTHCTLVDSPQQSLQLNTQQCPHYVMPNADAHGYYRFALSLNHWQQLLTATQLTDRERQAAADSLSAAFHRGQLSGAQYLSLLPALFDTDNEEVWMAPLADLYHMAEYLVAPAQQAAFQQRLAALYQPAYERVAPGKILSDGGAIRLRTAVFELYAELIKHPALRQHLTTIADQYLAQANAQTASKSDGEHVSPNNNIRKIALQTAVETDPDTVAPRLLEALLASNHAAFREDALQALAAGADAALAAQLRALALSEQLRDNEVGYVLEPLMNRPQHRQTTWDWINQHFDAIVQRIPSWFQGRVVNYASEFCDSNTASEIQQSLTERVQSLGRGPRSLANTVERIELCEALVEHHREPLNQALR